MNILIIGFYPDNNIMYPHLKLILDSLKEVFQTNYFCLRERGYTFDKFSFRMFIDLMKDCKRLIRLNSGNKYDKIIAIDHFAYYIASLIFPVNKIIFWSFDIISFDTEYFQNKIVKFILKKNRELLKNNGKIIIQNEERLSVLEKTLEIEIPEENIHLMPVFISVIEIEKIHKINNQPLILMQATSFDGCRYTTKLIKQFQKDNNYDLYLHGLMYEAANITSVFDTCEKIPILSTLTINPNKLYKIIKKSDIGFVGCELNELNCKFMYGASGQLLEFLRLAKPVIAFGPNNLGEILEKHGAGVCLQSMDDLSLAVKKIAQNYEEYSKNALALFNNDFNPDIILNEFIGWVQK